MSEKPLSKRYREHEAGAHRVKLTPEEQASLQIRSENHSADKEITTIRAEMKGLDLSISLLKEHRERRARRIKELQEGKRKAARGRA